MTTVVLDPACTFERLREILAIAGYALISAAAQPMLPGEPEHAVFEHASAPRVHYTFNPVCRLRVLEFSAPAHDDSNLAALPVVAPADVEAWLASADERTLLRGILAGRHLPDPRWLPRLEALRAHPRVAISQAAAKTGGALQAALGVVAQQLIAASTHLLAEQLRPLLLGLGQDPEGTLHATLRPAPDDYPLAFLPKAVAAARETYEALWTTHPPRIGRASPHSDLKCHLAPAGMLLEDNALSRHFPGGYRRIAPLLDPHRVWVAWKLIQPGHTDGMAYDGLVWLDDHWAWFPKPYRHLAPYADRNVTRS